MAPDFSYKAKESGMCDGVQYGLPKAMDNCREYVNSVVLKAVEDWPGKCTIINGRPRHPQTQDLVEQANGTVERIIVPFACYIYIQSSENLREDFNWAE
jgi:hypothetical protein